CDKSRRRSRWCNYRRWHQRHPVSRVVSGDLHPDQSAVCRSIGKWAFHPSPGWYLWPGLHRCQRGLQVTFEEIRELIVSRVAVFAGIEQNRIFYPNAPYPPENLDTSGIFKPPASGLWCRLNIQYATAFMAGMA